MTRSQRLYCNDILERIARIEAYSSSGRSVFMQDRMLQDGVSLGYKIIGEAVKRLDSDLLEAYPNVIWSEFARLGDGLIDRYHEVSLEQVWQFTQEYLPSLKAATIDMRKSLDDSEAAK